MKVVRINESLVEYFSTIMDLDSVSKEFRDMIINQFKEKVEQSLNCGTDKDKQVFWVNCK